MTAHPSSQLSSQGRWRVSGRGQSWGVTEQLRGLCRRTAGGAGVGCRGSEPLWCLGFEGIVAWEVALA